MAVFAELRRRNVFKVALLYAVASWLIVYVVRDVLVQWSLPTWTEMFTYLILALGFPAALWFAWTFEITPAGLKKAADVDQTQSIVYKTGQKLNAAVAVLLVLGVLAAFGQRLMPTFEFLVPGGPEGEAPVSAETPADIRSLTFDNGLKIVVWPEPGAQSALLYTLVHARHADGVCVPGHVNAYSAQFSLDALEAVFQIEADRLHNVTPDLGPARDELGVSFRQERLYTDTRNRFPVYGRPTGAGLCSEGALIEYYQNFYTPDETTIVVIADVAPDDVFLVAEQLLGAIPSRQHDIAAVTPNPSPRGVRRTVIDPDVQLSFVQLTFHGRNDVEHPMLQMALLLYSLIGDDASRLSRALVDDAGVAVNVDGHMGAVGGPAVAHFEVMLAEGGAPAEAEGVLLEVLRDLAENGLSEEELAAARAAVLADVEESLATPRGRATSIGLYEIFVGDYEALFAVSAELQRIGATELQEIAAELFTEANLSVGIVQPK